MPIIYKRKCNYCKKYYEGYGKKFCSGSCRAKNNNIILGLGFQKGNKFSLKEFTKDHKDKISKAHLGKIKDYFSPSRFKKGQCIGSKNPNWKGGKVKIGDYWYIYKPEHPRAIIKYVKQAVLTAEKCLGRYILSSEPIHHINGIKNDDRPENLYIFPSNSKHLKYHHNPYPLTSNLL